MLFRNLGIPELLLILVVVLLLFGPGRIARIGGELGKSIRGFKDGLGSDKAKKVEKDDSDEV
jgi:sec-independent protein translocase protein TatA